MKKLKQALILATLLITTLLITACSKTTPPGDYAYYAIYDSIYQVNTNTKKSSLFYKKRGSGFYYNIINQDEWMYGVIDTAGRLCYLISLI